MIINKSHEHRVNFNNQNENAPVKKHRHSAKDVIGNIGKKGIGDENSKPKKNKFKFTYGQERATGEIDKGKETRAARKQKKASI